MTAAQWTVLDNLLHGWNYQTNLRASVANEAVEECIQKGWIANGDLTNEGSFELQFGEGRLVGRFPCSGE